MSILSTIKAEFSGFESDVAKFAAAFTKLFKKVPSALQTVENFTAEAAPVITAAVAIVDPVAEPAVSAALATAETLLAAVQASAQAAISGTSLLGAIQNFSTTVPELLVSLDIKNPVLKASIERIVALVNGEAKVLVPAVESWVAQIKAAKA
jgi:hypothetical protein